MYNSNVLDWGVIIILYADKNIINKSNFYVSGNVMITCVMSLMLICIVFFVIQYSVSFRMANEAAVSAEDGLAASCMAGLSIDMEKFTDTYITGKTDVIVKDAGHSYSVFTDTLSTNLNKNNNELLHNVKIKQYIVYNIYWDRTSMDDSQKIIDIYFYDEHGLVNEIHKPFEDVYSPNGIKVTKTSVYADILFDLDIFGGKRVNCHKQLLSQAYKK